MVTTAATNLVDSYLDAKETVIRRGFAPEIDWQDSLHFDDITERDFLRETAWVILCSGMREAIVRRVFPAICEAFFHWSSAEAIASKRSQCRRRALVAFAHEAKVEAILSVADTVSKTGFMAVRQEISRHNVFFLQQFPYIGPTTSYHLAKNLGLDVAKPDRHLLRVSKALGFKSPQALCSTISDFTGEKVAVVDLVIWRFATIEQDYLAFFNRRSPRPPSTAVGA